MSLVKMMKITPCFCLPLKGGTIFIAVIASIWSFAMWFASFISLMISHAESFTFVCYRENCQSEFISESFERMALKDYQFWQFIKIVFFFFSLSAFILSICLLYGVIKDKPTAMRPWLCMQFGSLFLFAGFNFAWLFTGHYFVLRFAAMIGHIFGLFVLTMYIYIFMVLLSYYELLTEKQVKSKKNSGRVIHDASFAPNAPVEIV